LSAICIKIHRLATQTAFSLGNKPCGESTTYKQLHEKNLPLLITARERVPQAQELTQWEDHLRQNEF
jgi:hypothetical protein